jgi:uncharacterized protein (TIGR03435 family)
MSYILRQQAAPKMGLGRRLLVVAVASTAAATTALAMPGSHAQSSTVSANKLEFEVASVRPNKSGGKSSMNVDPLPGDHFVPTGGLYSAKNIVLIQYIAFAYKLTLNQLQSVVSQVPWVANEQFDIEARAGGDPTKDQYRMMMQSLLADRFKMTVHYETRQIPVFGLVLAKPGKLGSHLRLHQANDPICSGPPVEPVRGIYPADAEGFPEACGNIESMEPSGPARFREGGRDLTMAKIASSNMGVLGGVGRPMLDQTDIKGTVDFSLEWAKTAANVTNSQEFHPDEDAPSFIEALREQLGLKLVPQNGPSEIFVVDHIEHPSLN